MHQKLATSSIEDGLDFACNLAVSGILAISEHNPSKTPALLHYLAQYVQFRYVNEFVTASVIEHFSGFIYGRSRYTRSVSQSVPGTK